MRRSALKLGLFLLWQFVAVTRQQVPARPISSRFMIGVRAFILAAGLLLGVTVLQPTRDFSRMYTTAEPAEHEVAPILQQVSMQLGTQLVFERAYADRRFGSTLVFIVCHYNLSVPIGNTKVPMPQLVMIAHVSYGWPFRNVDGFVYELLGPPITAGGSSNVHLFARSNPLDHYSLEIINSGGPGRMHPALYEAYKIVPYGIRIIPTLADLLVLSVAMYLMLWLGELVRAVRRIKRGLCPACAYPVGTSGVCTECGSMVKR